MGSKNVFMQTNFLKKYFDLFSTSKPPIWEYPFVRAWWGVGCSLFSKNHLIFMDFKLLP